MLTVGLILILFQVRDYLSEHLMIPLLIGSAYILANAMEILEGWASLIISFLTILTLFFSVWGAAEKWWTKIKDKRKRRKGK